MNKRNAVKLQLNTGLRGPVFKIDLSKPVGAGTYPS